MKRSVLFVATLLSVLILSAQGTVQHAEDAIGKSVSASSDHWVQRVAAKYKLTSKQAAALGLWLNMQMETILASPLFHPPQGFDVTIFNELSSPPLPGQNLLPPITQTLDLYYLLRDSKTGAVSKSMDGTSITFQGNNIEHVCEDQGSFAEDCKKLHLPVFFEQMPVTDSTADYIELNFSGYGAPHTIPNIPIRLIRRTSRPLFIPFTRKEYLQYLMAKKGAEIKQMLEGMDRVKENIVSMKKSVLQPSVDTPFKNAMLLSIKNLESEMPQTIENINRRKEQQQHYRQLMEDMSLAEASSHAWINRNRLKASMDYLDMLLPNGRGDGVALYKVNPNYYDRSPSGSAVQLITVYYNLPRATFIKDPDYLQQKTMQLFDQLDYHRLKESMH